MSNKMGQTLLLFSIIFAFTACSNKGGQSNKAKDYTGTWVLEKTTCDGEEIETSGLSDRFKLNMEQKRGSNKVYSSSCIAQTSFEIKRTGNTLVFENSNYICTPGNCTVSYSIQFDNKKVSYSHKCPQDFPSNGKIQAKLSVGWNHMTINLTSTRGVDCVNTYRRD